MVTKISRYYIDKTQLHHPMCVRYAEGGFSYTMRVKNGQVEEEKVNLSITGGLDRDGVAKMNVERGTWRACSEDDALAHLFPDRPAMMEDAW